MEINLALAVAFLLLIPLVLLVVWIIAEFPSSKIVKWFVENHTLVNGLASLATIFSVALSISVYFYSEHNHVSQQQMENQGLLNDFQIEIKNNRETLRFFRDNKNQYIKRHQSQLVTLQTSALQRLENRGLFHGEIYQLLFDIQKGLSEYNQLLELLLAPALLTRPDWDTFNRDCSEILVKGTPGLLKKYDEIENKLQTAAANINLKYEIQHAPDFKKGA